MDIKNNYYFKSFEGINLVYNEYWDFNLISDNLGGYIPYATNCKDSSDYDIITDGLVTWFDINQSGTTLDGSSLTSLIRWSGSTIIPLTGFNLDDWGLTGVDNGRTDCLSGKTLIITSADTKLVLYPVTGYTITYKPSGCTTGSGLYSYPWFFHPSGTTSGCSVGDTICLDGGFYQGFFKLDTDKPAPIEIPYDDCGKTGYTLTKTSGDTSWGVMPTEFENGWSMETWVKRDDSFCSGDNGNTLNSNYPNNKNFFFYIGTKAENKFFNNFSGETGLKTSKGIPLSLTEALVYDQKVVEPNSGQNWFDVNGTTSHCCSKCDTCGAEEHFDSSIITGGQNWFNIAGFTPCCVVCSGSSIQTTVVTGVTYSYCDQLSENALGFRITDDGKIGYRKMTVNGDCYNNKYRITGTVMEEGYSEPNTIAVGDNWSHIVVTYTPGGSKNTLPSGTLKFWINGLVKYKVDDFIGLQLRALDEWSDKQIGVPFNMSWGGGTQGLTESQTFGGPDYKDRNLLLQTNFAGTFEGELSQLRFYEKPLNVLEVRNNFFVDCDRYCRTETFGGNQIVQPNSAYCVNCNEELLEIDISVTYLEGSIVCLFTATTKNFLTKDITVPFLNNIYFKNGSYEQINSSILIEAGKKFNTKTFIFDRNFSDLAYKFELGHLGVKGYKVILTSNIKVINNIQLKPKVPMYYGKLTTTSYTDLTEFNKIDVNAGRNIYLSLPYGVGYGYILISNDIDQPKLFRNSNEGCVGFVIPMINLGVTTVLDNNGNPMMYNIYRTFVATKANVDVWLCD